MASLNSAADLSRGAFNPHAPDTGDQGRRRVLRDLQVVSTELDEQGAWPIQGARRQLYDLLANHRLLQRREEGKCWSQEERHLFYSPQVLELPPQLVSQLQDYSEMQKRCMNVADWEAFLEDETRGAPDGADLSGCKYVFATPQEGHGVGNRIVGLASVFTYALLTNRAIILRDDAILPHIFCNPFRNGAPWTINGTLYRQMTRSLWKNGARNTGKLTEEDGWTGKAVGVSLTWVKHESGWPFFCPQEQEKIKGVRFVILDADTYFVPSLYFVPELKEKLDNLVPDRRVFLRLSHFLLHPANHVWATITHEFLSKLSHYSKRLGIQVRNAYSHTDMRGPMTRCAMENAGVLPDTDPEDETHTTSSFTDLPHKGQSIAVFIASLDRKYAAHLKYKYAFGTPKDGSTVDVITLSAEGKEKQESKEQYAKAVVEMWLLSFSDVLLTTPISTLGHVAAGLSGIRPYLMSQKRNNEEPVCTLGEPEPCQVTAQGGQPLKCGDEGPKDPYNVLDFIKICPDNQGFIVKIS